MSSDRLVEGIRDQLANGRVANVQCSSTRFDIEIELARLIQSAGACRGQRLTNAIAARCWQPATQSLPPHGRQASHVSEPVGGHRVSRSRSYPPIEPWCAPEFPCRTQQDVFEPVPPPIF
jgi:hypothetical protein